MVEISESDGSLLLDAVRTWTGWGQQMMPCRDDASVRSRFGVDAAAKLLPILNTLAEDFYSTNARFMAADLEEMGTLSAAQFREKHPKLPAEIAEAFAWCYTFDFK